MGYKHGIKVARRALGYLVMQDELLNRMILACGRISELGGASKFTNPGINRRCIPGKVAKFRKAGTCIRLHNLYQQL